MMWPSSRFNRHNDVDFFFNKHFILNFETILQARLLRHFTEDLGIRRRGCNQSLKTFERPPWDHRNPLLLLDLSYRQYRRQISTRIRGISLWKCSVLWKIKSRSEHDHGQSAGHVTCWGRSRSVWPLPPGHTSCRGWRRHPRCWTAWAPGGRPPGVRPGTLGHQFPSLTESRWLPWCVCCIAQHI